MDFLSTTQTAEKWHISARRIQILCNEGRINGAVKVGANWIIPADAVKPSDERINNGKSTTSRKDAGTINGNFN